MRIIAGALKGRRLKAPDWAGLRPTSDKLRETVFNVLAPRVAGARVLDGYAGTGALGIEALSRGASWVVFVERDRRAGALIQQNLKENGVTDGYAIIATDIGRALTSLGDKMPGEPFDIVLLDPPYATRRTDLEAVLSAVGAILAPDGITVLEHARRVSVPVAPGRLLRSREKVAGDSALAFYELKK